MRIIRRCFRTIFPVVMISLSGGCASKLVIEHSATGNGISIPKYETIVITKNVSSMDKNGKNCETKMAREFPSVLNGESYTVNVDPALFASNDFSVEFYESGVPKKIGLSSDPQVDETIQSSANLVKEVGGLMAKGMAADQASGASGGASSDQTVDKASCGSIKEETILCVKKFKEWMQHPNCN
ncbi:hypothetical protein [Methylomonas koyamae]|uniref:hypothetical protein n=1 Tax=Methylomonas koyamae TaxID=702114 RepID=UPI002873CE97|nr:hypothetical protein [Methylomonas koyamae]WNB74590.1 hypothetical protein RI210_15010 [Methylomonas koyamae]